MNEIQSNSHTEPTRAFTLIEILIVVALIGIISTIGLWWLADSRSYGRDSARVADVQMLTLALEQYYGTCRQYPEALTLASANGCPTGITLADYLPTLPLDPAGASYDYATSGSGSGHDAYVVRATLERHHPGLATDIDGTTHKGVSLDCDDPFFCIGS